MEQEHVEHSGYSPFAEVWDRIESKIERQPKLSDIWRPHEGPQKNFFESRAYEVLYGGAAAGGKSDALLYDGLQQIGHPNYKALLLRRSFPELRELIDRSMETFPRLGGKWNEQQKRWTFPSGAIYEMGYCETYADVMRYQGQEYTWIGFDEIGHIYEERIWTFLMSRNRSGAKGLERYMRASANPGGPGHGWLKRRFISTCRPDGTPYEIRMRTGETMTRAFYQAFLKDNPTILQNDPGYASRLEMLPDVEYKWLAEGDWNAGAGMALGDFNRDKHYIEPFEIPKHWTYFGSFDWGYNHPFSFGLFACDEDGNTYLVESVQGRKLKPDEIVHRITDTLREKGYDPRSLSHIAAGHDCWADRKARGELVPTIAEQFYELGMELSKANISRISGVQNLRRYLSWKTPDGTESTPKFRIFKSLANARVVECLESRVSDPDNIEDVLKTDASDDGEGGDDTYDMVRYGLASRPYSATPPVMQKQYHESQDLTEFEEEGEFGRTSTMAQFGRAWA